MANAKKIIRIVAIILLVIGLFTIIYRGYMIYNRVDTGLYSYLFDIIVGPFLLALGLVFLLLSRKKISAANAEKIAKTIVAYILIVIGLTMAFYSGYGLYISGTYWYWFVGPLIIGVILFVNGFVFRILSVKKNSKSPDKSIT